MVSDITNLIRRSGTTPNDVINKILQDIAEIQPELKGDTKQERIIKVNDVYQINQTTLVSQWTQTIDDETGVVLDTENDVDLHQEIGNS